ncbi:hypothetical protein AHMF7605_22500 [Adhaeribacter arboris]|uniref:Uncharacterized protein n=1 Tax=Adhaeribacter arboris TaxID=2072846 RepID=A0A2T2YKN8_9BACT|nr:hypothetical protein [Adhaeribacter arboris]PSR56072.1 hypothetical protein AHMF7605_22500 [Adhaeribacter arboris]
MPELNRRFWSNDLKRWRNMDFVLGYEVKPPARTHLPYPICQQLAGIYPKWFEFTGWREDCGCSLTPIMPDEVEYSQYEESILNGTASLFQFRNMVTDVPHNFKRWVADNQNLEEVPDFVKANFVNGDIKQGLSYPSSTY